MKLFRLLLATIAALVGLLAVNLGLAQEGSGPSVGQRVDQAIGEIRQEARQFAGQVREKFDQVRARVEQMSVAARVYARIRWDKTLNQAAVDVDVDKDGVATLTGTVPSEAAKAKASSLAGDTIGIERVVNNLQIVASTPNQPH